MSKRLTENEARELHEKMMQDPEYREKWEAVVGAVFGCLCDIPDDALKTTSALGTEK